MERQGEDDTSTPPTPGDPTPGDPTSGAPPGPAFEDAHRAGLHRITMLAWRDLADAEAGGSEVHADRVASAWAAGGLEVTMRTSAARGHPHVEERNGYRVVRRSGRNVVFPKAVRDHVTGRLGPADGLVEVWNGVPWLSPLWFRGPRVAFIHHVHVDMWELSLGRTLATIGRTLERRSAPLYRTTTILTPSEGSRRHILDYLRLPESRVRVVPPGVDAAFTPGGERSSIPTVLAVGRLVPHKRVEDLIRIVPDLRRRVPGVRLVVVGEGYHRTVLEDLAASVGVADAVEFRRAVGRDELVDAYREAWVVTSASIAEGWGMTITEAAACGTPAVASRIGGHTDAIVDGTTGLLADDPSHLADQLTRVLTDDDLRRRLGEQARSRAQSLSWQATADGVLAALVDDAVSRRR
jgi:glycosyltransferase involved in cell wall biosynthesis